MNRIENKVHPSEELVVIAGHSEEEVDGKLEEYLKHGNPQAILIRIVAAKIDKCPDARN